MTESSKAVFLSHASQDAEAAGRLSAALRAAGIEVWFDQSELRGGDAWNQKIHQQIRDCALFVALISVNTQARLEGYFRREWHLAVDRTHDMAEGKPFLVPVVIDDTQDQDAHVPDKFRDVQWVRLPHGQTPAFFCQQVVALLAAANSASQPPISRRPGTPAVQPRRSGRWVAIAAAGVLLAVAIALQTSRLKAPRPSAGSETAPGSQSALNLAPAKSIAVLPFVDMSEKQDQQYFSDGLSEELIDHLVKVAQLHVPARTSSFYFKGQHASIAEIAKALNVAHVLEGSVRKAGRKVRVTAQLIRVADGYHLWSETYDRELKDVFRTQDDIANAVVAALQLHLPIQSSSAPLAADASVYDLLLQAHSYAEHRTKDGALIAAGMYRRILALDPKSAAASAGLAFVLEDQVENEWVPQHPALEQARAAVRKAIRLDPTLAAAHSELGWIYLRWDRRLDAAEREFRAGLKLAPNDSRLNTQMSYLSGLRGQWSDARRYAEMITRRDPLFPGGHWNLAIALYYVEDYDAARKEIARALQLAPQRLEFQGWQVAIQVASGRATEALGTAEVMADGVNRAFALAIVNAVLHRTVESDQQLAVLKDKYAQSDAILVAFIYAVRGEAANTENWIRRAGRQHEDLADFLYDPILKRVPNAARYRQVVIEAMRAQH